MRVAAAAAGPVQQKTFQAGCWRLLKLSPLAPRAQENTSELILLRGQRGVKNDLIAPKSPVLFVHGKQLWHVEPF